MGAGGSQTRQSRRRPKMQRLGADLGPSGSARRFKGSSSYPRRGFTFARLDAGRGRSSSGRRRRLLRAGLRGRFASPAARLAGLRRPRERLPSLAGLSRRRAAARCPGADLRAWGASPFPPARPALPQARCPGGLLSIGVAGAPPVLARGRGSHTLRLRGMSDHSARGSSSCPNPAAASRSW